MYGLAEQKDGLARYLVASLIIGKQYSLDDLAHLLHVKHRAVEGKGVLTRDGSDAQILLVSLEKDKYSTPEYKDYLNGSTFCWTGQNSLRSVEKHIQNGTRDTFVFLQKKRKTPFLYYGRAIPLRMQVNWDPSTKAPSHVIFDLPEYADTLNPSTTNLFLPESNFTNNSPPPYGIERPIRQETEMTVFQKVRTVQTTYRENCIKMWNGRCAVTAVDNTGWLIASHIKPWRESNNEERVNPSNSLLLAPDYDKLFDRGVISFSPKNGDILLPEIETRTMWNNLQRLHIDDTKKLRFVTPEISRFLEYHNRYVYNYEQIGTSTNQEVIEELLAKSLS